MERRRLYRHCVLDYVSIIALNIYVECNCLFSGSHIPAIYYGFYCEKFYQIIYMSLIVIFGLGTVCRLSFLFKPSSKPPLMIRVM